MDLVSAVIWILKFIGSHYLGKAYEYVTEPHEEDREPFVERYIKLREEVKWFESLTEETLQNTYKAIRLYAEETIPEALEYIETNYGDPDNPWDGTPEGYDRLKVAALNAFNEMPEGSENKLKLQIYGAQFAWLEDDGRFIELTSLASQLPNLIANKELFRDQYNENSLELGKMYIEHPWIKQATEDMTIDSTDSTIQVIFEALDDLHLKIDTAVEELTATDTSLEEQINSLLGIETSFEGCESNLSTAVANIPNTIATMAPIYPVCSCGAGSTAGVSDGVSGETFVEDIVSGVVTGVGRMEVKVNEQVFGEMVDRRNNQNLKNALAGRGVSWV